jgi:hypothetical protein
MQSALVMKKALELNFLTRNRHGFALAIDPSSSSRTSPLPSLSVKDSWDSVGPVELTLCCSKPLTGMSYKQFSKNIKDFAIVAYNVQSQLESIDDGRLGVLPLSTAYTYDEELGKEAASPAPLMCAQVPQRKHSFEIGNTCVLYDDDSVDSTDSIKYPPTRSMSLLSAPAISTVTNTSNQPSRATSISSGMSRKSFVKKRVLHFKSPGEARLFETFMRKKKEFVQKSKDEQKKLKDLEATETKSDDKATQRALSIGTAAKQSLVARECDHTPLISNRKNTEEAELEESASLDLIKENDTFEC